MWVVLLELLESLLVQQHAKEFSKSRCRVAMAIGELWVASPNNIVRVEHHPSNVVSTFKVTCGVPKHLLLPKVSSVTLHHLGTTQ
tara:strand:- start:158 stop:412 length:255 start_codon:yes stop_codon:yes gene_type:complete